MMFKYYKNDKEFEQDKAIEEMTKEIEIAFKLHEKDFEKVAVILVGIGYRKITDEVVLTDDEYERWQGQTLNIKKVRKETAEKFKKVLESKLHPLVKGWDYFWYNQYEVHNAIRETCKEIIGEEK